MTDPDHKGEAARVMAILLGEQDGEWDQRGEWIPRPMVPERAEQERRLAELIGHNWEAAARHERERIATLLWSAAQAATSAREKDVILSLRMALWPKTG